MSGRRRHHPSFDSDPGEDEPLENTNDTYDALSHQQYNHHHQYRQEHRRQQSSPRQQHHHLRHPPNHPGAHPDSAFSHPQSGRNRRNSRGPERAVVGLGAGAGVGAATVGGEEEGAAPVPPPHQENIDRSWGLDKNETYQPPKDNVTPDADNFSEAAAGGMPGLAYIIAERNPRESGLDAMSGYYHQEPPPQNLYPQSYERSQPQPPSPYDQYNEQGYDNGGYYREAYEQRGYHHSPSSGHAYAAGHSVNDASSPSLAAPGTTTPTRSHHSYQSYSSDPFGDPHAVYSQRLDPSLGQFNPNDIDDDGDDGLEYRRPTRNSMLSTGDSSNSSRNAAAAGAAGGVFGGLIGGSRNGQVNYGPVGNVGPGGSSYDLSNRAEKSSDWITKQNKSKKRWRWCVIVLVGLVIAGAIAGGVVGGTLMQNKKPGNSTGNSSDLGQSAVDDQAQNGDLDINSPEIKELMNNPNLHKVFPGVDYTPINVQYPECIHNPPSQNNVTRDVAVLSQLTNTIRLYGTDCNQTEMAIHAVNQLQLKDEMKIWMGVWQDNNDTTNKRQLEQMWTILDTYGDSYFKGIIVANEILFRQQMTASQLGNLLDTVRSNLSNHNWGLPVATSDLGDDWTPALGELSDYIMANIHPFFAGVDAKDAASWTYTFWETQNRPIWKKDTEKNVISEVGWPTKGGKHCGSATVTDCAIGSVAGIDELNQLLNDWVCPALNNGTNYFWFEMFDEPWKERFNEDGKEWEDQWGLMDVNRNLKPGVKIPDCGGKTVGKAT